MDRERSQDHASAAAGAEVSESQPCDRERIAALEERVAALDRAIEKAELTLSKRLEAMNEIREAMKDQASKHPTRMELYWALMSVIGICGLMLAIVANR